MSEMKERMLRGELYLAHQYNGLEVDISKAKEVLANLRLAFVGGQQYEAAAKQIQCRNKGAITQYFHVRGARTRE